MTSPTPLIPVGVVRGGRTEISEDHWGGMESQLILDPAVLDPDATGGLAEFSHIEVAHSTGRPGSGAAARPHGNPAWPQVGVLAGHSPVRPNHLGASRCELLAVTASS
jgi:tRNA (Thr-GGU) A37 N-methylase